MLVISAIRKQIMIDRLLALLLIIIISSCHHYGREDELYRTVDRDNAKIEVSIEPDEGFLVLGDLFSSGETVYLKGCRLNRIQQVFQLDDGRFIVVASRIFPDDKASVASSIGIFSVDGQLLSVLARIGNGPDEVVNVQDVKYNRYTNTVDVLSNYGRELARYDIKTSKKIETVRLNEKEIVCGAGFLPVDETLVLIYKNMSYSRFREYKLYLCDSGTGEILMRSFPFDKQTSENVSGFGQVNNLCEYNGTVYFSEKFLNTIYAFSQEGPEPYIGFKENKYSLPESILRPHYKDVIAFQNAAINLSKIYDHGNFFFSGDKIFSSFCCFDEQYYINVISLDTQQSHAYRGVTDNLCTGGDYPCNDHSFLLVGSNRKSIIFCLDDELSENPILVIAS